MRFTNEEGKMNYEDVEQFERLGIALCQSKLIFSKEIMEWNFCLTLSLKSNLSFFCSSKFYSFF